MEFIDEYDKNYLTKISSTVVFHVHHECEMTIIYFDISRIVRLTIFRNGRPARKSEEQPVKNSSHRLFIADFHSIAKHKRW